MIGAYVLLSRHILGFHIRLTGQAPRAARFAGVQPGAAGGVLPRPSRARSRGWRGCSRSPARPARSASTSASGYGFTAIIVAFLGRLHPVGILLAGLLMALTYIGGELAQLMLGLPGAAIQAFQGMLLFFLLAVDVFTNYRLRIAERGIRPGARGWPCLGVAPRMRDPAWT